MSAKEKTDMTVLNNKTDWIIHIVMSAVQLVAVILISCLVKDRSWVFWTILVILVLATLYFGFMFVYKVYRGRLTIVNVSRQGLSFYCAFKNEYVKASDIVVELIDVAKPSVKKKYAEVYAKGGGGSFVLAISCKKTFEKFYAYAPEYLIKFIIACTDETVLKQKRESVPDDIKEYIDLEIEARIRKAEEEKKAARKKRK